MIDRSVNNGLVPPSRNGLVFVPTLYGRRRRADFGGHRSDATKFLEDAEVVHEVRLSHNIAHSQVRQSPFSLFALYRTD